MPGRVDPLAAAAALFAWGAVSATPSVDWLDSGNLVASAWTMGVAHPPGEPAYLGIAKLAQLVPLGDLAFRVSLLSAACVAACVFPLVAAARAVAGDREGATGDGLLLAMVAAMLLALGPRMQAVRAEVYGPVALLLATALAAGICWRGARASAAIGGLIGLGAAVHPLLCAAAVPGLAATRVAARDVRPVRDLGAGVVAGVAGFAAYAWLPLRAAANPARAWGLPDTAERFTDVLLARTFARNFGGDAGGTVLDNLATVGSLHLQAGVPLLALLAVVAAGWRRPGAAAALVVAALWVAGNAWTILPQNKVFPTNPDLLGYLFVGMLGVVPAAAAGLAPLGRRAPWVVGALAVLLALSGLRAARPDAWGARSFAAAQSAGLPTGSILVPSGNSAAFAWAYLDVVERRRPDVVLLPRVLLGHPQERVRLGGDGGLAALGLRWTPDLRDAPRGQLDQARRPAYVEMREADGMMPRHGLVGASNSAAIRSVMPEPPWVAAARERVLGELDAQPFDAEAAAVRAYFLTLWGELREPAEAAP